MEQLKNGRCHSKPRFHLISQGEFEMYNSEIENEISAVVKKFDCESVANAIREVFMHEYHKSAPGSKVKGLNPLKKLYLENGNRIRLFDHARFYPGFVVFHPYSLIKDDLEFLVEAQ